MASDKAGLHGYSSPNKPHVIFCADIGMEGITKCIMDALGVHYIEGEGCYKNKVEPCYAVDYDEFWKILYVKIRPCIKNQETFLILGTLRAMNRRAAELHWQQSGKIEPIGTWREVADVRNRDGWSEFNGRYYAISKNPAPDRGTEIERETAQLVLDLRNELAAVLVARMSREQGQLLRAATVWLNGETIVDGTKIVT